VLSAAHADQTEIEFVIGEISTDAVALVEVQYENGQAVFVAQADESQQQIRALERGRARRDHAKPGGDPMRTGSRRFTIDADRLCASP
jgi:hypothetical protein